LRTQLAAADFSWPGLRQEFVLDLLAELGFVGVDLGLWTGYTTLTPEDVRADARMWAGRVRERLERRGLEVSDVFPVASMELAPRSINHPDPSQRSAADELFRDMLEFAACLGARHMTILPGVLHDGQEYREALERSAEALAWRREAARREGIVLAVEGHVGSHVDTPEKILELLELTPGLTLTLDFGHFAVQGMPDTRAYPLLPHASHFHVRGSSAGLVQTRFADNAIDFAEIVRRFDELGYGGWLALEYVHDSRPGCSECDNIQETMLFRDFLRRCLSELPAGSTDGA
jgi:sugar phosphate isomerase/epimerase